MVRIFEKCYGYKVMQSARIRLLGIGKYAFETKNFLHEQYETNINMPLFNTEEEAYAWIEQTGDWKERERY